MTDLGSGPLSATAAAATRGQRGSFMRFCRKCTRVVYWVPGFLILLAVYAIMVSSVDDMRVPFMSLGGFELAWVEVLYVVGFLLAMLELLKVSRPGKNDTGQVLLMTLIGVGYVVLFALGAAGVGPLAMFAKTEFIVVLLMAAVQAGMAAWINGVTAQRTIGTGHDFD